MRTSIGALRESFGLAPSWEWLDVETADARRIATRIRGAVRTRGMLAIAGPRGSGKTRAVWQALDALDVEIVEPLRLDRARLHLGDLQAAMVRDLTGDTERPRHSAEARAGQVRRLLHAAARPVVLVIDEAHDLHHATIRGLKRLRELGARRRPVLTVLLVGQADATERVAEVGLRSDRVACTGLTAAEVRQALGAVLGDRVSPAAAKRIAAAPRSRNWLDLQALVDDCLAAARQLGADGIHVAAVAAVIDPSGAGGAASADAKPVAVGAALRRLSS